MFSRLTIIFLLIGLVASVQGADEQASVTEAAAEAAVEAPAEPATEQAAEQAAIEEVTENSAEKPTETQTEPAGPKTDCTKQSDSLDQCEKCCRGNNEIGVLQKRNGAMVCRCWSSSNGKFN